MKQLTKEQIHKNLANKIDNETFNRLQRFYPLAPKDGCPTCNGRGKYVFDASVHLCDCEYQRLLQKHYFAANIGREYHNICLEHFVGDDREKVVPVVEDYVDAFQDHHDFGLGITFSGRIGTGKTFAMCIILKELIKQGRSAYFVSFADLINIWGQSWNDDEARRLDEKLRSVSILGIDELRTDKRNAGGFLSLGLESIIRHRVSNLLPTLISTNLDRDEEKDEFYKSYSLLSARNLRVKFTGEDVRGTMIGKRERKMKDLNERRPLC